MRLRKRLRLLTRSFAFVEILASIVAVCEFFFASVFASGAAASPAPIVIGNARFTVLTPQVIRMEYNPSAKFIDAPSLFAIHRDVALSAEESARIHITPTPNGLRIDTGFIQLVYVNDGKPFSSSNLNGWIRWNPGDSSLDSATPWSYGQNSYGNLGGTLHSLDYVQAPVSLGEGLLSQGGWYYLDDSQSLLLAGALTAGAPDSGGGWVSARPDGTDRTDGFLFGYGPDYASALRSLTRVSGEIPLPRRYALGAWYSRWWPYTSNDYRRIVQEFHEHDFPLDMLVMDMDWHITTPNQWTGLSWNRALLPDAEALLAELHQDGLHVTLNDHPQGGIQPDEDCYPEFMHAMGQDPSSGKTLAYDAGDLKYIETLFSVSHTPLEKEGVDFWWLDWMGDDQSPFNKMSWMNELYFRHSENSQPERSLRGMSFSRWAGWGDQRHPIHFSGDVPISWSNFAFEVPFTATAQNVGADFWSHDIGGFIDDDPTFSIGELLARWTQFGATTGVLRLHSANKSWLDKRPWTYSADVEDSMRRSFHLRSELFPYIYSAAWKTHETSVGFDRPLYMDFPGAPEAYQNPQEYLWGDAFLVAPITTPGAGAAKNSIQRVWFPEGRWFDWFSGLEFPGETTGTVLKDLSEFPLYARGGMPIVMQPYTERMTGTPLTQLIVRVYPGENGKTYTTDLYEDDGETRAYLQGAHAITHLTYAQEAGASSAGGGLDAVLNLSAVEGRFAGQPSSRSYEIQFASFDSLGHAPGASFTAWVNGVPASAQYDQDSGIYRVEIPQKSLNVAQTLRIHMDYGRH